MPALEHLLADQDWLESFQVFSGGESTADSLCIVLSSAGFERVQEQGINAVLDQCRDLLASLPSNEPSPQIEFARPAQLDDLGLPLAPEYAALRYWQVETERQAFLLEVDSDWEVFSGHFPDFPILPGIIQLHWAAQYAHHFMGRAELPLEVRQLKFHNIFVPPGWLVLELQEISGSVLKFLVSSVGGVHAQGKLLYAE